jgi:hypothetical protein
METKFLKTKRPIDYLPDAPKEAIRQVWKDTDGDYVLAELPYWLYMALSHESTIYNEDFVKRASFITFYTHLLPFVEASYFFNEVESAEKEEMGKVPRKKYIWLDKYQPEFLDKEQAVNPITVIAVFYNAFPLSYARIELWDFFEAVQFYEGPLKQKIYPLNIGAFYLNLLTLVEARHLLASKSTSVTCTQCNPPAHDSFFFR